MKTKTNKANKIIEESPLADEEDPKAGVTRSLSIKLWQTSRRFRSSQVMEVFVCMNIPAICEGDAKVDVAVKNPVKLVHGHFTF